MTPKTDPNPVIQDYITPSRYCSIYPRIQLGGDPAEWVAEHSHRLSGLGGPSPSNAPTDAETRFRILGEALEEFRTHTPSHRERGGRRGAPKNSRVKMDRAYALVPYGRRQEAKEHGGRWDPGAKLWWFPREKEHPFTPSPYDGHVQRAVVCRGQCLRQTDDPDRYEGGCGACDLARCPNCQGRLPARVLDCHGGRCMGCAIRAHSGAPMPKTVRACKGCGGPMRSCDGGWDGAPMHKKCWRQGGR